MMPKVIEIQDPEIVLGPSERKKAVHIPVIENSTDLKELAQRITLKLKAEAVKPAETVAVVRTVCASEYRTFGVWY